MADSGLRVELRGADARLGEVRASDVARLILATERAIARVAGVVARRPVAATGRRTRPVEEASRLRLVAIV